MTIRIITAVLAVCSAVAYGAESIQARIDAAAKAGGGVVRVAAGTYRTPALRLRSGVTLHLEKGALLQAGTNAADYAESEGHAFILAEHVDHVAIEGEGVIDGGGRFFPPASLEILPQPRIVWFRDCRDVRVEGVTLRNGRRWSCFFDRCDGVVARGIRIRSTWQRCCDGIDLECRNALVENCDIDAQDDAICLKARCSDYTVENIEVRNCRVASNCAQIKVGSETLGRLRNIRIHDIACSRASESVVHGDLNTWPEFAGLSMPTGIFAYAGISLQMLDGGILEDVEIRDVDLGATALVPILVRLSRRRERIVPGTSALHGILLENVKGEALAPIGCSVIGSGGFRPADLVFRNVALAVRADGVPKGPLPELDDCDGYILRHLDIMPAYGFYLRHADGVRFENVVLTSLGKGPRPLFAAEDCTGVTGAPRR